jgi:nuclear transport factor 2 (NTF2) superfamily protein
MRGIRAIRHEWRWRAVRFACEWHDSDGNWMRSYGNEFGF